MKIIHFNPNKSRFRRLFEKLPFSLYEKDPNWVPPLRVEERRLFSQEKHSYYGHGQAAFFLAVSKGQPIGRLVVLNNRDYNVFHGSKTAHFFQFESRNNPEIAFALFEKAAQWGRENGLTQIVGPKGMTPLDGLGLLVRGFQHPPAFGMPYNPEYYPQLLQDCGFTQVRETVSGYLSADLACPQKALKVANIVKKRRGFRVLKLRSRKDLLHGIHLLGRMYNSALSGTEETMPLTQSDLETMSQGLLWLAKPSLVKLILKDEEPAGFLLAYPDISKAIKKTNGRLYPFGWIRLLQEKNRTPWVNINGMAISEKYQGLGATALLFTELYKSVTESGQFRHAEVVQIGTENERMLLELRGLGIDFYKSHGIFSRDI